MATGCSTGVSPGVSTGTSNGCLRRVLSSICMPVLLPALHLPSGTHTPRPHSGLLAQPGSDQGVTLERRFRGRTYGRAVRPRDYATQIEAAANLSTTLRTVNRSVRAGRLPQMGDGAEGTLVEGRCRSRWLAGHGNVTEVLPATR